MRTEVRGLIKTGLEAQLAERDSRNPWLLLLGYADLDMDRLADDVATGLEELRLACSMDMEDDGGASPVYAVPYMS